MAIREAEMPNKKLKGEPPKALTPSEYPKTDNAKAYLNWDILRDWPKFDPKVNPVRCLIRTALNDSLDRIAKLFDQILLIHQTPGDQQPDSEVEAILQALIQAIKDHLEIRGWMYPVRRIFSYDEAFDIAKLAHESGLSNDYVKAQ